MKRKKRLEELTPLHHSFLEDEIDALEALPRNQEGLAELLSYLRGFDSFEGWRVLFQDYSDLMEPSFLEEMRQKANQLFDPAFWFAVEPCVLPEESADWLSQRSYAHSMKLCSSPFEMIKNGKKTIELRLFDDKRQQIKEGDVIVFTNIETGETLETVVKKLHRFNSFAELYEVLPLLKCGYTEEDIERAHPSDMESYYSAEEQGKYGVVGIELCLTNNIADEQRI